jgi:hypothetical protein
MPSPQALGRLHHVIPPSVLGPVERAPGSPQLLPDRTRDIAHACNAELLNLPLRQAYRTALAWLDNGWGERPPRSPGSRCSPSATLTSPTTYETGTACTWWNSRCPGAATGIRSLPTSSST